MDNQISPRTMKNMLKENLGGKYSTYAQPDLILPFTIQRVNTSDSLTSTMPTLPTKKWISNVRY